MKKIIPLLIIVFTFQFKVYSQATFTAVDTLHQHLCLIGQTAKFFDYDNDNDLDIIRINSDDRLIYENTGNSNFNLVTNFPAFPFFYWFSNPYEHFRGFVDYDNDGDVDVFCQHENINRELILENTLPDSISFIEQTLYNINLASAWENIHNYQGKDFIIREDSFYILSNLDNSMLVNYIDTINTSDVDFSQLYNNNRGFKYNYDINNDGFMDIITLDNICVNNGFDSINKFSIINRNTYTSTYSSSLYADFNNDGYIDEFGVNINSNNQNNGFSLTNTTGLVNNYSDNVALGDFNNDGRIDVIASDGNTIDIYYNVYNFTFFPDTNIITIPSYFGIHEIICGDYDDDGDLDIAVRQDIGGRGVVIYQNNSQYQNTPPTKPTKCWSTIDHNKIIFHWNHASDIETPSQSLSYNVMVGTTPNGIDIVSPMADTVTGFRRVVEIGNAQLNNFFILDKSKFNIGDTIYWRVQTIDNGMQYSEFSNLNTLVICDYMEAPVYDTICSNDSVLWRGNYYSTNGIHKDTYGVSSCDSTFSLNLKVNPAYIYLEDIDICSNESYTWRGQTYYSSGTHINQFTTTQGCDSIYKLDLNVHHSVTNILDEQICVQDSFPFAGGFLNSSGFYTDSSQTVFGCDSLSLLTLTVSPSDTTVFKSNDTLFTTNYSAYKRWYNCETQSYVPNQNNSYFIPNQPGKYAAEITENGCTWMSGCFDFTYLGIKNYENIDISVEPNPASNSIKIISDAISKNSVIKIYSTDSKLVYNRKSNAIKKIKLNIENLSSGVYFIKIINPDRLYSVKFVKE